MKHLNKVAASMVITGKVLVSAIAGTAYVVQSKNSESGKVLKQEKDEDDGDGERDDRD